MKYSSCPAVDYSSPEHLDTYTAAKHHMYQTDWIALTHINNVLTSCNTWKDYLVTIVFVGYNDYTMACKFSQLLLINVDSLSWRHHKMKLSAVVWSVFSLQSANFVFFFVEKETFWCFKVDSSCSSKRATEWWVFLYINKLGDHLISLLVQRTAAGSWWTGVRVLHQVSLNSFNYFWLLTILHNDDDDD